VFVSFFIAATTSNASRTPLEITRPARNEKQALATSKTPLKGLEISAVRGVAASARCRIRSTSTPGPRGAGLVPREPSRSETRFPPLAGTLRVTTSRPWTRTGRPWALGVGLLRNSTTPGKVSGIIEPDALVRLAGTRERRSENRGSMCPYKRPYNSGATRIRLLPPPSAMSTLTCGKPPVGDRPAPSFPAYFRIPKPCAQVRILPGALACLLARTSSECEVPIPTRHSGSGTCTTLSGRGSGTWATHPRPRRPGHLHFEPRGSRRRRA
jgi:hypothetical protein